MRYYSTRNLKSNSKIIKMCKIFCVINKTTIITNTLNGGGQTGVMESTVRLELWLGVVLSNEKITNNNNDTAATTTTSCFNDHASHIK